MSKWKIEPSPWTSNWWHLYKKRRWWWGWQWIDCGLSRRELHLRAKELDTPPEIFET